MYVRIILRVPKLATELEVAGNHLGLNVIAKCGRLLLIRSRERDCHYWCVAAKHEERGPSQKYGNGFAAGHRGLQAAVVQRLQESHPERRLVFGAE